MDNTLSQTTRQVQTQQQVLSPQQIMLSSLTELPVEGLRDRIQQELEENQWLEAKEGSKASEEEAQQPQQGDNPSPEDAYDDSDDNLPRAQRGSREQSQRELKDTTETFYDHLTRQLVEYDLTPRQKEIACYLIGSLEDDGMLRTPLRQIADELDIYQNVQASEEELETLLTSVVEQMEPAGVGARSLQECLTLQASRLSDGQRREQLLCLFTEHWEDFCHTRWQRIQTAMRLDGDEMESLLRSVRRLNPRPGGSIGTTNTQESRTVTPDFIVTLDEQGRLRLRLNEGDLPTLTLSPDAEMSLSMPVVTKEDREAVRYIRDQVASAQLFINAIEQRRRSMLLTMKAIIRLQRPFFTTGDELRLRPMRLEDVAALTKLSTSTTSRVANSKYVETPYGTYPLRWFFTSAALKDGDEVSVRNILTALKDIVASEDKRHPLTDEKLQEALRRKGYTVARRTVAKYRAKLGIPESRLR
ncbi:MAG: RNA polymerase factor sigma-54 [Prevotellaceae bacterium]|nr:RNA polymerase factor sigma-54 [Prevotellaceae bacterium]